jgi:hypothetical protein
MSNLKVPETILKQLGGNKLQLSENHVEYDGHLRYEIL